MLGADDKEGLIAKEKNLVEKNLCAESWGLETLSLNTALLRGTTKFLFVLFTLVIAAPS